MENRRLKFRAWDKTTKKMIYDANSDIKIYLNGVVSQDGEWVTGMYEIMQFTGLLDKEGREIYEGDILEKEGRWITPKVARYEVVFDIGEFIGGCIGTYEVEGKGEIYIILKPELFDASEILGNIYENEELLAHPSSKEETK